MPEKLFFLIAGLLLLSGCAASGLSTQVEMGNEILIPFSTDKTIFIEANNTSAAPLGNLTGLLDSRFRRQGFQVVSELEQAHYYLRLDVVDFAYFNETTQPPPLPSVGVGVGAGWGVGLGIGVGLGSILGLAASQQPGYTLAGYVRIEERRPGQEAVRYMSNLLSSASQSDITFEQASYYTRDAMIEKVIALFEHD